jgi:anti-sigma regulatory factor (Ser/Thr protein kinase)
VTAEGERQEVRQQDGPGASTAPAGPSPLGSAPLDQAFDRDSLYALRSAVAAHAAAAGMGRHQVYDVTAVAHELAANAVLHGAGNGRLRLWADDKFLYCQVSDDGPGAPAGGAVEPDGAAALWPAEHGHGLWLAGQIADHVSIGHGPRGTTATVRFALSDHRSR